MGATIHINRSHQAGVWVCDCGEYFYHSKRGGLRYGYTYHFPQEAVNRHFDTDCPSPNKRMAGIGRYEFVLAYTLSPKPDP